MAGNAKHAGGHRWGRWRIAIWSVPALFMLLIAIAMQFSDEVDWTWLDFAFAGFVLYGALGAYELVASRSASTAYRTGVGVAILAAVMLVWSIGAVGLTDSDADGFYFVVLAIGVVGAFVARFQPTGMARAMFVTALATGAVGVVALVAGIVPTHNSAVEILGMSGFFVMLFSGSSLLFRDASQEESARNGV